jgi:tRNA modification GTPase
MLDDTIAAVATPPGEGSIGIIRLSGSEALTIAGKLVKMHKQPVLAESRSHNLRLGKVYDPETGEMVDEVMACVMRAPHSYTREDVVEINCHGGPLAVARVLQLILRHGARLAEAGEFTRRAFLNGRLDLTQAEAVLDIIRARSQAGMKAALGQLEGKLASKLAEIDLLIKSPLAAIEASMDFPEEVGEADDSQLAKLRQAMLAVEKLLNTWEEGRLLSEGIKVAIIGRPNVGKSSLLNALLKQERAIVSNIPGTTRDTIEEMVQLGGFPCRLIDTAGLRATEDVLENIGVARTRTAVNTADVVLLLFDLSAGFIIDDKKILDEIEAKNIIVVGNKADLLAEEVDVEKLTAYPGVAISAREGTGLTELAAMIQKVVLGGKNIAARDEPLLTRARHRAALGKCGEHLKAAISAWENHVPFDLIAIDLWAALNYIGEITGATTREDLLDTIFDEFCIGK